MQNYSKEQIKDIKDRTKKAEDCLKELELYPAAMVHKVKVGDDKEDIFADKVVVYLQDNKYRQPIKSPFNA